MNDTGTSAGRRAAIAAGLCAWWWLACPVPLAAQEQVLVRRLSDTVAVRETPRGPERVLYYFEPTVSLVQGGHVEQGSGGHSEITLSAGGLIALHAAGHVELVQLSQAGDVLRFPTVTRMDVRAGDRPLELILPGGTRCRLVMSEVYVETEPGRLRIRHQAQAPVQVIGDLRLAREPAPDEEPGRLMLLRGEEVVIPLFGVSGDDGGYVTTPWGALTVRHPRDVTIAPDGARLHFAPEPADGGARAITVGGVRTRVGAGAGVLIHDPRHAPALAPAEPTEAAGSAAGASAREVPAEAATTPEAVPDEVPVDTPDTDDAPDDDEEDPA